MMFKDVLESIGIFIGGMLIGWFLSCCGLTICQSKNLRRKTNPTKFHDNDDKF